MKPIPAEGNYADRRLPGTTVLPTALPQTGGPRPVSNNRKNPAPAGKRIYPALLTASTLVAGTFCYLYLTKPVLLAKPSPTVPSPALPGGPAPVAGIPASLAAGPVGPSATALPGDVAVSKPRPLPPSAGNAPYEETNFSIQHVLTAEAPGGAVKRLDLKVPVLYQSRNLRWTTGDVAEARKLLLRLSEHQQKTDALKAEATALQSEWNKLIERTMPPNGLQADSPTLVGNQETPQSGTPAPAQPQSAER